MNNSTSHVTGIILAAGTSKRFGKNKLLESWHGMSLLRHCCLQALASNLTEVIVILDSTQQEIRDLISDLNIRIMINPKSIEGQASSIRIGVSNLTNSDAAIIILADQPFVEFTLIDKLIESWKDQKPAIIAPFVHGIRANPILFCKTVFPELCNIKGDTGGRQLLTKYKLGRVVWNDPRILQDIDSKQQLEYLKRHQIDN